MSIAITNKIEDQNVISASVESVIADKPILFRTNDNIVGVALYGVLMPVRFYIAAIINAIYGHEFETLNNTPETNKEFRDLYRGVTVPSKYSMKFADSPLSAAVFAVSDLFREIREKENCKELIAELIRTFDEEYAILYVEPEPKEWLGKKETDNNQRIKKMLGFGYNQPFKDSKMLVR